MNPGANFMMISKFFRNAKKAAARKGRGQDGFSLIEFSISIIVLGVFIAGGLGAYQAWAHKKQTEQSLSHIDEVARVITAYRSANGRYPCPAPLGIPRTDPTYGYETDCADIGVAVDTCAGGICVASSPRVVSGVDIDDDGVVDPDFTPRVRIGMVPFRNLNFPEDLAHDAFGGKILYAVTEVQAGIYPYKYKAGGIDVLDEAGNSLLEIPGSADFTIISHGDDRKGSYTAAGNAYAEGCDLAVADGENCDMDAIFRSAPSAPSGGAGHFDDLVRYQVPLNMPLWARSPYDKDDIYTIRMSGNVGSDYVYNWNTKDNEDFYGADTRLFVNGNVLVEGNAETDEFCNETSGDCFQPKIIGGEGVNCTAQNLLMMGIQYADKVCSGIDISIVCPDPTVVQSFDQGKLVCGHIPCKDETVESCSQSYAIPGAPHGTEYIVESGDAFKCNKDTYICEDGSWKAAGTTGFCTCPAGQTTDIQACDDCYSGEKTYQRTVDCGTCTIGSWTLVSDTCTPIIGPGCFPGAGCTPTAVTWATNCSGTTAAVNDGEVSVVSNAAPGYGGTATYTCSNGTWTGPAGESCTAGAQDGICAAIGMTGSHPSSGSACTQGTYADVADTAAEWKWNCAGTDGGATANCSAPKQNCSSSAVTWLANCTGNRPVTNSGSDTTVGNVAGGYSGSATYSCDNGTWAGPTGETCAPAGGPPCNLPWGGTINDGQSVTAYQNATEPCDGSCKSETRVCSGGTLTGGYTNQSCSKAPCPSCGGAPNTCAVGVVAGPYTQYEPCLPPAIIPGCQVAYWDCTSGGKSIACDLIESCDAECTCTPDTETRTSTPCPVGQSGTITEKRDFTCPDAKWGSWYEIGNTCAPTCTPTSETRTSTPCPVGQSGTITEKRDFTCPAATWGSWYQTGNTCAPTCTPTSETRTSTPCPVGQSGTITEKRDFTCPAATWSAWYQTGNTCAPITGTWVAEYAGGYSDVVSSICYSNQTCSPKPTVGASCALGTSSCIDVEGYNSYSDAGKTYISCDLIKYSCK